MIEQENHVQLLHFGLCVEEQADKLHWQSESQIFSTLLLKEKWDTLEHLTTYEIKYEIKHYREYITSEYYSLSHPLRNL